MSTSCPSSLHDGRASSDTFVCPGELQPISRSIHLARLAAFYPGCDGCVHRDDDAGLSSKKRAHWLQVSKSVPSNEVRSADAGLDGLSYAQIRDRAAVLAATQWPIPQNKPVLLGSDGRSTTAEAVAAVCEGLRFAGLDLVDTGAVSAPCLRRALRRGESAGAMLTAGDHRSAQAIRLHAWDAAGKRLVIPAAADSAPIKRPTRHSGSIQRDLIADDYLAELQPRFHGLRPLTFIVDTRCQPLRVWLKALLKNTACTLLEPRVIAEPGPADRCHLSSDLGTIGTLADSRRLTLLSQQVVAHRADFALWIDGVGENSFLLSERGELVPDQLLDSASGQAAIHPDALDRLATLLVFLSQSDRPLSRILDSPSSAR